MEKIWSAIFPPKIKCLVHVPIKGDLPEKGNNIPTRKMNYKDPFCYIRKVNILALHVSLEHFEGKVHGGCLA